MSPVISLSDSIEADEVVAFYESMGFARAGKTVPMWVYAGTEH